MNNILKTFYILITVSIFVVISKSNLFATGAGSRASFARTGWVGGEYVAMGMTGSIIANDVYSIYWNPAGLNELKRKKKLSEDDVLARAREGRVESIRERDLLDFSEDKSDAIFLDMGFSGSMLAESRNAVFAGVAFGLFDGVAGIGVYTFGSMNIDLYDEYGTPQGTTDYVAGVTYLSYAWSMGVTNVGLTVKGLYEKIDDISYIGGGIDFGAQVAILPFLSVGFTATDLGTGLYPVTGEDDIKKTYDMAYPMLNLGAALNAGTGYIIVASISKRLEQEGYMLSGGIKYELAKYMNVMLGMSGSSFSAGVSLSLPNMIIAYGLSFDRIDYGVNNTVSASFFF